MKSFFLFFVLFLLLSCRSVTNIFEKKYFDDDPNISVYNINQNYPANAKIVKKMHIQTSYFANYTIDSLINIAKYLTKKNNGNAFKIISNKPTRSIFGNLFYKTNVLILNENKNEKLINSNIQLKENLSTKIFIYRYKDSPFYKYKLNVGDTTVTIGSCTKNIITLQKNGVYNVWASRGTYKSNPINLKFSKRKCFYIKCSYKMKLFVAVPQISIVDSVQGNKEFNTF